MTRRILILLAMLAFTSTLVGCGPRWGIVAQAVPNPFMAQKKLAVAPISFEGLRIGRKTEPEYIANKGDKQAESFQEDKAAMNEEFTKALIESSSDAGIEVVLATGPGAAPFLIQPSVTFLEPGFYVGVAAESTRVTMTIRITSPDGQMLDEITTTEIVGASLANPSSGGRYRSAAKSLGRALGKYLKARTGAGG